MRMSLNKSLFLETAAPIGSIRQFVGSKAGNVEIKPQRTDSEPAIEVNHSPLLELFICEVLGYLGHSHSA